MLQSTQLPLFVVATLTLLLTPGPAVLYVIARSIHQGRKAGVVSALGLEVGTLFQVVAMAFGLSALLLSSALAFNIVKYLGAGYLVYLGVRRLLSREDLQPGESMQPERLRRIFLQGVLVNMLNPKTALFFFAFLPQFVDPTKGAVTIQLLFLGILFVAMATITDSAYGLLAGSFGHWLRGSRHFMRGQRYFAGTIFIGLGVTTALTGSSNK